MTPNFAMLFFKTIESNPILLCATYEENSEYFIKYRLSKQFLGQDLAKKNLKIQKGEKIR